MQNLYCKYHTLSKLCFGNSLKACFNFQIQECNVLLALQIRTSISSLSTCPPTCDFIFRNIDYSLQFFLILLCLKEGNFFNKHIFCFILWILKSLQIESNNGECWLCDHYFTTFQISFSSLAFFLIVLLCVCLDLICNLVK